MGVGKLIIFFTFWNKDLFSGDFAVSFREGETSGWNLLALGFVSWSPWKVTKPKGWILFQPSIFRGKKLAVKQNFPGVNRDILTFRRPKHPEKKSLNGDFFPN